MRTKLFDNVRVGHNFQNITSHRTDKYLYNLIDKYIVHQNLDTKTIFDMLEKFRGLDVDWRLHLMLLLLLPFTFPPIFAGCKQDSAKLLFLLFRRIFNVGNWCFCFSCPGKSTYILDMYGVWLDVQASVKDKESIVPICGVNCRLCMM